MAEFRLSGPERLAKRIADLRIGVPVRLSDGDEAAWVASVETLTPERLEEMRALGRVQLALTARRAETLKIRAYDGDLARIEPGDLNTKSMQALADPSLDLDQPLRGPFAPVREGNARIARAALRLAKRAHLLPAVLLAPATGTEHALAVEDILTLEQIEMTEAAAARVPLSGIGDARVHVFRPRDGGEEHYAIEVGIPHRDQPVLVRLHSACFTGDVIGSLKCDCGSQLKTAMNRIGEEGAGVLLYLNQEGRGIGLANKMRAYHLQDQGFDTVEANHRLGFEDDERDFRIGAEILRRMGFGEVRLMTNNPAKVRMMEQSGIHVAERVPLTTEATEENRLYLATKARKSGHIL